MRILLLGLGLVILLSSCASVIYEDELGNKIKYSRFWNQEFKKVEFTKGDLKVKIEGQKAGTGDLAEALKNLSEVAKRAMLAP